MNWDHPTSGAVIDIGGSKLVETFTSQLPKALAHDGDFPKEIAYTAGMDKWNDIASISYQTTDEMQIIKDTCAEVVSQLPSGTKIIDLGAAGSEKYEPYVREFLAQGKTCTYVPLDLSQSSLQTQVNRATAKFPTVPCVGLWGSFQDGDAYYSQIPSARLFLSLGSIFYNGPEDIVNQRCKEFHEHFRSDDRSDDRLIVGQDGPNATETSKAHASYGTKEYTAFFTAYLNEIQRLAGIDANATAAWTTTSTSESAMHFFLVTANHDMVCKNFDNFFIKADTTYRMFKSWKHGETAILEMTKQEGLGIKMLKKADTSGMRQFMIKKETNG
ncbi:Fc.00g115420.m01.CDS01 [Cosmosporella sp. VM-42]